mgnify:CR=1 FL=1
MNLHDWIDELCDALDIEEADLDEGLILDVAREAAHNVARPAAPITSFLLGFAAARYDGDPEQTERLAALAMGLAQKWDKPAGVVPVEEIDVPVEDDSVIVETYEDVDGRDDHFEEENPA